MSIRAGISKKQERNFNLFWYLSLIGKMILYLYWKHTRQQFLVFFLFFFFTFPCSLSASSHLSVSYTNLYPVPFSWMFLILASYSDWERHPWLSKVSYKLPCIYVCLSSIDIFIFSEEFPFLFLLLCNSILFSSWDINNRTYSSMIVNKQGILIISIT